MSTDTTPSPAPPPVRARRPQLPSEQLGLNDRIAATMTRAVGSMWAVYASLLFFLTWITLASVGPLHGADPYPFPFLLFLGNVVQLLLVFVILVGQGILGRLADRRAVKTYTDAEAILGQVVKLQSHMVEQDMILNRGIALVEADVHPWIAERKLQPPVRVRDQFIGFNGRLAAWITERVSSMWAFYAAAVFQFGWMGLALAGIIRFDPYPFAFLLFLSSVTQLIFMFVIMVGQDVLGRAGETRAEQTFLDAEAILQQCRTLQRHLTEQDRVIVTICSYVRQNAPPGHQIHAELGRPPRARP